MNPDSSSSSSDGTGAFRTVVERPPPGLARGKYSVPAWAVVGLGAAILAAGIAYLGWRLVRRAKP
jgi:hypothetical protein